MVRRDHPSGQPTTTPLNSTISKLARTIDQCRIVDQPRLRQQLKHVHRPPGTADTGQLAALEQAVEHSLFQCRQRQAALPEIRFPDDLPITGAIDRIREAISEHQVVVVAGATGSGKSTQIPKLCLAMGFGIRGLIGHTQPRRVAARSIATRLREELGLRDERQVGYKIRFSDVTDSGTYIKVMTDGILLAELQQDRLLRQYDCLILDEAHERSLNIDFLIGYLRKILPKRPDLRIVITSATIDTERFSKHFNNAPVIEVSGRTYPVEVRYRPFGADTDEEHRELGMPDAIVGAIDELFADYREGDLLVFLPGEREIRHAADAIRKRGLPNTEVLPLYSRLSAKEQDRIFRPGALRRIVLATNVAETSLTVPRIRFVIDPGYARISRYGYRSKMQRLPVEPISRASADQRKGRCGRVAAGVCIRLYSEEDFLSRPEFTTPEILRTSLASVILQMASMRLGHIDDFPFLQPPDSRMVRDGYQVLHELGAINKEQHLTDVGRQMARMPVDPRLARILVAGATTECLGDLLIICSALSVQDPRERPHDARQKADQLHGRFNHPKSDFIAYLELWRHLHQTRQDEGSANRFRTYCQANFISYVRYLEWRETYRQLKNLVLEMGLRPGDSAADYASVHRALIAGLASHCATALEQGEYLGARNKKLWLFPGSGLAKRRPRWILSAEVVETSRVYARCVAEIDPAWIETSVPHLCQYQYSEPYWQKRRAQVGAKQSVTVLGLTVVQQRAVSYGAVDPTTSRELFIRHALIYGEYATRAPYAQHNRQLIEQIEAREARARRRDLMEHEEALFQFFDQRIPPTVYDGPRFERWRRKAEQTAPKLLFLNESDVLAQELPDLSDDFPEQLTIDNQLIELSYLFEPGNPRDGVTASIPLGLLNQLRPEPFTWLVPGLRAEKIEALLRALPKSLRRQLIPVAEYARACHESLQPGTTSLAGALAVQLQRMSGQPFSPQALDEQRLPDHLRMGFSLQDSSGQELEYGRDLMLLQQNHAQKAAHHFASERAGGWGRRGVDRVPDELFGAPVVEANGIPGYPALMDTGEQVNLVLCDSAEGAERQTRDGLLRLAVLQLSEQHRYLKKELKKRKSLALLYTSLGNQEELISDILTTVAQSVFPMRARELDSAEDFSKAVESRRGDWVAGVLELADQLPDILELLRAAELRVNALHDRFAKQCADAREQLARLYYRGFVGATPPVQLRQFARYAQALQKRLEKLPVNPTKDLEMTPLLHPVWRRVATLSIEELRERMDSDEAFAHYRWMLEELRVSLFAQELKTPYPVSVKRLEKQWSLVSGVT